MHTRSSSVRFGVRPLERLESTCWARDGNTFAPHRPSLPLGRTMQWHRSPSPAPPLPAPPYDRPTVRCWCRSGGTLALDVPTVSVAATVDTHRQSTRARPVRSTGLRAAAPSSVWRNRLFDQPTSTCLHDFEPRATVTVYSSLETQINHLVTRASPLSRLVSREQTPPARVRTERVKSGVRQFGKVRPEGLQDLSGHDGIRKERRQTVVDQ
jgi:hypothetical protein